MGIKIRFAYKTGFRRLWLAVSVLWMIFIGLIMVRESSHDPFSWLMSGFLPVVVLYALGALFVWVVEGFARIDL